MPNRAKISLFRGDSHTVSISVTSADLSGAQVPFDLTGATAVMSVKSRGSDSAYVLQKSAVVVSPSTSGVLQISLAPGDTSGKTPSLYVYDVQITTADSRVYTVVKGAFELKEDVTTS